MGYDEMIGKDFMNYTVYEDGTIVTPKGKFVKPTIRTGDNNRPIVRLRDKKGNYKQYSLSRVVYKAFNPEFDITDKEIFIAPKDGDSRNCSIDNLTEKSMMEARGNGRRVIPIEDTEKIRTMIQDNMFTYKDVAEIYDITLNSVSSFCKKNDIKKPKLYW